MGTNPRTTDKPILLNAQTYIPVAVVVVLLGILTPAALYFHNETAAEERRVTQLETLFGNHITNEHYHSGLARRVGEELRGLNGTYVRSETFRTEIRRLEEKLEEIKRNQERILRILEK